MYVVFAMLERRFTGWSIRVVDYPIGG
jgi:hypothetical protein